MSEYLFNTGGSNCARRGEGGLEVEIFDASACCGESSPLGMISTSSFNWEMKSLIGCEIFSGRMLYSRENISIISGVEAWAIK